MDTKNPATNNKVDASDATTIKLGLPTSEPSNATPIAKPRKNPTHVRPYIVKDFQFFKHAKKLKNKLLIGEIPCQYVKAGACQNSIESGKNKTLAVHIEA